MEIDRRIRGDENPNRRIAIVWAALCVIFILIAFPRLQQGQFPDPDDTLRLVQVRDLLAGQPWFDLHQYRIGPPEGSLMHWSRLVDIPLAAIIALLSPIVGAQTAEAVALIIVPLLTLGAILLAVGRTAWRLFDVQVAGFACLAVGLFSPLVFQLQPMRIDHHGWQIFSVAAALWAISTRKHLSGGSIAGLAMAFGLSISIELLPLVLAFASILGLRWLRDPALRWWLVTYMQALAMGLVVFFFATRGVADLAQHCDTISPAHLGFFVIAALGTGVVAALPKLHHAVLVGVFLCIGAAALAFFGWASPVCLNTPFGDLDPLVRDYWYVNVAEGQPLWRQEHASALPILIQLLIAFAATLALALRSHDWQRCWWSEYALLFGASIVLSIFVWRSAAFASIIATIPLGWLASRMLHRFRVVKGAKEQLPLALAIIVILLPAAPVLLVQKMLPQRDAPTAPIIKEAKCVIRDQAAKLDVLQQSTIFAPLDIGPAILLKSNHSVVATGHHRAEASMHDVIDAFTDPAPSARAIMRKYDADYLVMCVDLVETGIYAAANPDGLSADIVDGNAPDWLEPVEIADTPEEFKVWKIQKD